MILSENNQSTDFFGALIVVTHMYVHLGDVRWLPTTGLQDLLTGYPMGALFIVVGIVGLTKQG